MEGARGERDLVELLLRRFDYLGVAVAEVQRRVGGEHVEVFASLGVADHYAVGFDYNDVLRMIVVCAEFVCLVDDLLSAEHCVVLLMFMLF